MEDVPVVRPRKRDHDELWVAAFGNDGGYFYAYDTEAQLQRNLELAHSQGAEVLLAGSVPKDGAEKVAYRLEAVCEELLAYLDASPENLALPAVRNRFRARLRTLLTKAQAHGTP